MPPPKLSKRFVVQGSVQGVGYRYFAYRAALELQLTGMVRNLDDGSVEVIAVGTPDQLSRLAGRLHLGPPASHVRHVEEQEAPMQQYDSFSIKR